MSLTIPTTFGIPAAVAAGGGGGGGAITFVGSTVNDASGSASGPVTWPVGTTALDAAIIVNMSNGETADIAGWLKSWFDDDGGSTDQNVYRKVLTSTDVASPPSIPTSLNGWHVLVYRNLRSFGALSSAFSTTGATTLNIPGQTVDAALSGVLNTSQDRSNGAVAGNPPGILTPRTSTQQAAFFSLRTADILDLAPYVSGAVFPWTGYDGTQSYRNIGASIGLRTDYSTAFPAMTGNSAPAGYVASATNAIFGAAWNAFSQVGPTTFWGANTSPATLTICFPTPRVVSGYTLVARSGVTDQMPRTWTVQGSNDGSTWSTVDAETLVANWAPGESRGYSVAVPAAYLYYQIVASNPNNPTVCCIAEWSFTFSPV